MGVKVRTGQQATTRPISTIGRSAVRVREHAVVTTTAHQAPSSDTRGRKTRTRGSVQPMSSALYERERIEACRGAAIDDALSTPIIAVLVPVLGRPARVRPLVESFTAATSPQDARLYFVAQRSDTDELEAIAAIGYDPILVDDVDRSWARKINRGFTRTTESWLLLGADDLSFHAGWVDPVRDLLRTHAGVIGTNDLGNPHTISGATSTHPLVRRLYADICGTVDEVGKILHEGYDHNYPDTELARTAMARGMWVHRADCVIEHMHPAWGKAQDDATYRRGQERAAQDHDLFVARGHRFGW